MGWSYIQQPLQLLTFCNSLPNHITQATTLPAFKSAFLRLLSPHNLLPFLLIFTFLRICILIKLYCFVFTLLKRLWVFRKALYKSNVLILSLLFFTAASCLLQNKSALQGKSRVSWCWLRHISGDAWKWRPECLFISIKCKRTRGPIGILVC